MSQTPDLFRGLLPDVIATAEALVADAQAPLWPVEAGAIAQAVETRRREFAAGRTLARRALASLGEAAAAIAAAEGGAPLWPEGVVGSITHTASRAAVAAARRSDVASIGIDLEEISRFKPKLERKILTAREIERLEGLPSEMRQRAAALVFCAKESFYKLQHPLTSLWLGFHDAEVEIDAAAGAFRITAVTRPEAAAVARDAEGCYAAEGPLVATAMWLAA